MTQQSDSAAIIVSQQFEAAIPAEPQESPQVKELSALVTSTADRERLVCKDLLAGDTRTLAEGEAAEVLPQVLGNTQIVSVFGNDTLTAVNDLNDRMLTQRPPVDVPELNDAMRNLSRNMRGLGRKYDPKDEKVLEKYKNFKGGILARIGLVKTFFDEFLDDIRSLDNQLDRVIETLEGRQNQLLRNVTYYDEFYKLNEAEIDRLIYKIAVMEILRDLIVARAQQIVIGDSTLGDRGGEEQAQMLELVAFLDRKIVAFKGRLWVAWAMAPQIRTMRAMSVGLSARSDKTVDVTIPTMKGVIVVWLTLSEAQQAQQFNEAVEGTYNDVMVLFANAAKAAVPVMAEALETPALDPRAIQAWSESLSAQADGIVQAIETGRQKRIELEQAMITGKEVIDAATLRVNQAQLESVLSAARGDTPLEIVRSVPTT